MKFTQLQSVDAYEQEVPPSCSKGRCVPGFLRNSSLTLFGMILIAGSLLSTAGCGSSPTQTTEQAAAKPVEPAIPEGVQSAANAFLGKETTVLTFGDLAKNGNRQLLAANVVPKTPKNNLPGTIVTRAVLAEESNGSWHELVRCDEHLKNEKGYLGGSPIEPVV